MTLWPHQARALEQIDAAIRAGEKRICVTAPTGGGKTRMAIERIKQTGLPTVFYANRNMLHDQTAVKFEEAGILCGLIAAGQPKATMRDVQIAMIQTAQRRDVWDRAQEVMIDEAHNNSGPATLKALDRHGDDVPQIGFTATPLGIGHRYTHLIVAGTNSELRACGAHVPAHHFAPDEPDAGLVGKVKIGEGECGIEASRRQMYAHRVFGRVVDNYRILNPEGRPTILFAPGVPESRYFAEKLCAAGIPAAHIDGENVWVDRELLSSTQEVRDEIADRLESGNLKVVCNRFVLREGIDWPFVSHAIFATVFGGLTSYLQAGGRLLRSHPSHDRVTVQDQGGNWWRHGSLNSDREWSLDLTDRICYAERVQQIREQKEPEPIVCPKCSATRLWGKACHNCGYQHSGRRRIVLQANGQLKPMAVGAFKQRHYLEKSENLAKSWASRVASIRKSKKDRVRQMTFAQLQAVFAQEHNWHYPPADLPMMPTRPRDWFRPISSVPVEDLTR